MAIIYTYGFDDNVQDKDAWVGTNSGNRKTKQFTAKAVANYLNKQGKISIGGQMNYIFKPSTPNSSGSFTSTGNIKPFDSVTSLRIHVQDLSGGNVVDFMTYIVGSQLLIARQNTPSEFGHYVINSYAVTANPDFYTLSLSYIGGNGSLVDEQYYDLVALNIPDGTGSGVDTITTTDTDFISSTPNVPTAGNVTVTSSLSATGTPDSTTYLRGDNTWSTIPSGISGSGTTNHVAKWSASDELTNSVIYDDGANVGIGTTSPSEKLDVAGSVAIATGKSLKWGAGATKITGIDGSFISLHPNNSEKVRFLANGNVGIGTTSPTDLLHIQGASTPTLKIVDTTNTTITELYSNNFDTYLANESSGRVFIRTGGSNGFVVNSSGNVGIGTTSPSEKLHINGNTLLDVGYRFQLWNDNVGIYRDSNDLMLNGFGNVIIKSSNTTMTAQTERMRITSTGNVGIGTSSPSQLLHLSKQVHSNDVQLLIENSGYLAGAKSSLILKSKGTNGGAVTSGIANVQEGVSAGTLAFYTSGLNERMRITKGGNVGIGTTSPAFKLTVNSGTDNTIARFASTDGTGTIVVADNAGSAYFSRLNNKIQVGGTSGDSALNLTVLDTGNVGIGTTSPSQKLHVLGSGSGTSGRIRLQVENTDTSSAAAATFKCGTNSASFQYSGPGYPIGEVFSVATSADIPVKFLTNGSTQTGGTQGILFSPGGYLASPTMGVYPSNGGRVGIGTTSPSQKLHVNGSVRISDVIYDSSNSPGTAGQVLYKPTNDTIGWVNRDSITSIPTSVTATPGGSLSLASNIDFVYFTWSGGSGTFDLNLPDASTNAYRIIRFVCDSTVSANDKIHVNGSGTDTVDGGAFYNLNKPYNGVQVWSDGSEWIVIQAKAT